MFGISYVTFVFFIMYYAPNRLLPGCVCYWFTPTRYYQLISCINWPLIPAQNRSSPIPAASSITAQKTATSDRQKLPAQWVWKTAQLGGKTAELATLLPSSRYIGVARIFAVRVHSIVTSNDDDIVLSDRPNLPPRTLPRQIKAWILALVGGNSPKLSRPIF